MSMYATQMEVRQAPLSALLSRSRGQPSLMSAQTNSMSRRRGTRLAGARRKYMREGSGRGWDGDLRVRSGHCSARTTCTFSRDPFGYAVLLPCTQNLAVWRTIGRAAAPRLLGKSRHHDRYTHTCALRSQTAMGTGCGRKAAELVQSALGITGLKEQRLPASPWDPAPRPGPHLSTYISLPRRAQLLS